ncbi:MAG TPA: tyrosine-type recombinase/integrase [Thermoanaerobaculia bacterium]|jgi:site-specific recombinase XerD|nr:tyrosine-type recombinase/integrase [Thermoanaerobaculia bacterium]
MLTVDAAATDYIASLQGRHAPVATVKAYASDLRRFATGVPSELTAVDAAAVRAFLDGEQDRSPATRRRRHATLCSFFRWLVQQELVDVNPMLRVASVETVSRLPRPLAADTVRAVLQRIPPGATRDRALFTLLYETGVRVGEALGLQRSDVDLATDDEKVRVLGKGGRERTVLLTAAPESVRLLRRHLRVSRIASGSVFRGDPRYGGSNLPLGYTTVRVAWLRYCAEAGVTATIHQLRHSRASELVRAGVPLATVRKLLGHRNIQSTLLYAEVDQATVKRDLLEYQRRQAILR